MPFDRRRYPMNWEEFADDIKIRAHWLCEWPGCQAPHGIWIRRRLVDLEQWVDALDAHRDLRPEPGGVILRSPVRPGFTAPIKVVLTAAHTCDCDPICDNPDHVLALCQLHHLRLDARQHAVTAAANRRRAQAAAGQGFLWTDIDTRPVKGGVR